MARLCLLLCRLEDEQKPEELTELSRIELPAVDLKQLAPARALDQLESEAVRTGQEVMRRLLRHQWEAVEAQAVAAARQLSPPVDPPGGRR